MSNVKRNTRKTEQRDAFGQTKKERESVVRAISSILGIPVAEARAKHAERQKEILAEKAKPVSQADGAQKRRELVKALYATTSGKARPVSFAGGGLYQVSPDARASDVSTQITNRLDQVGSILTAIYGGGAEHYSNCSETVRDEILWALDSMTAEARELFEIYESILRGE